MSIVHPSREFTIGALVSTGAIAGLVLISACTDHPSTRTGTDGAQTNTPAIETPVPSAGSAAGTANTASMSTDSAAPSAPQVPPTPAESKAAWTEGVALYEQGDFAGASTKLRIASAGQESNAYRAYLFGLSLWKSGNNDAAEEALVRSATLGSGSIKTWINLARVRMELQDPQGALEAADEALKIDAGSGDALHQRARALAGLERTDEAIGTLEQALTASPENGYIANTLGYVLLRTGHADEAIAYLERARIALPKTDYVRNNLAAAYERTGRVGEAIAEYRSSVEAGDASGKAAASLARLEPLARAEGLMVREHPVPDGAPLAQGQDSDGTSSGPDAPNH
jgi:tetratricopeptide (TPR) repeat protein